VDLYRSTQSSLAYRPNDRTCGPTIRTRILQTKFDFQKKTNIISLIISADPILLETCNPAGGGFRRIVETRPDPDSRSGYPSIPSNHTSWDSTLVASLVKIGGRLRSVERSTRFVWQTHSLTHSLTDRHTKWFYNLSNDKDTSLANVHEVELRSCCWQTDRQTPGKKELPPWRSNKLMIKEHEQKNTNIKSFQLSHTVCVCLILSAFYSAGWANSIATRHTSAAGPSLAAVSRANWFQVGHARLQMSARAGATVSLWLHPACRRLQSSLSSAVVILAASDITYTAFRSVGDRAFSMAGGLVYSRSKAVPVCICSVYSRHA